MSQPQPLVDSGGSAPARLVTKFAPVPAAAPEDSKSEDWRHSRQPALFRGGSVEVDHQGLGLKLVDAATDGDFDLCEQLLLEGADPNFATVPYRYTALIKACRMHRVDVVNLLLSYNADPNCASRNGWTPLIEASRTGHAQLVELLISKGAKINAQNVMGWTALMEACRNRHLPVIKILCQQGAILSIADKDHMVALDHVSSALLDIRTFLERFWASSQPASYISPQARAQIDEHRSPEDLLVESARNDDFATVRTLIQDKGIDVNSLSVHGGYSALIFAARSQNREMVEFLISKGANVRQAAEGGWTPIIEASRVGNKAILDLLIQTLKDQGATPSDLLEAVNATNIFGWHALIEACRNNNYDVVERLVQLGADVLKKDEDGDSAMNHAVNNWIRGLLQGSVEGPRAAVRNKLQQTRQMASDARVKEVIAKIQEVIERSGDSSLDGKKVMDHRPSSVDAFRLMPTRMPTEDLRQTIFEACVQELDTAVVRAVLRLEGFRTAVLSSRTNIIHALVDLDLDHIVPPLLASATPLPPAEWPRISDVMEAILDELFGYGVDAADHRRRFISSPDHLNGRTATVECAIKYADIIEQEWQRVAKDEKDQLRQQMSERLSGPERKAPTTPKPSSGKLMADSDRTRGHSRGGSALPGISAAVSSGGRGSLPNVEEAGMPRPSHSSFAAVGIPDEARYYAETLRFLIQNGAKLSEHDAGNMSVAHHILRPIALVNPFPKALDDVIQNFAIIHRSFRSTINGPKVWNMKTSPDDITPLCLLLRANPHAERENLVFCLLEDGAMMPFSDSDSHKFELEQAILMSMVAARLRGNPMMAWNLIKAAVRNGDLRLIERTLQRNLPVYMVRPDYVPVLDRTHLSAKTSPAMEGESAYAFSNVPAYNDKNSQAMLLEDADKCLLHYAAFQEDHRTVKERQQIFKLLLDYADMPCKASPVDANSFWPWPSDPDSKGQGLAWMNRHLQNIFHIVAGKRDNITALNAIYFKELLRRDANANCSQLDGMGWSPLHYAAFLNKKDIVHELGTSHLDLMHRTHVEGRTALHLAALRGNWIVVQSLLARGVAVDLIDSKGCTALTLAMLERQRLLATETAARALQDRVASVLVDAAARGDKTPLGAPTSPGAGPERRPSSLQPAFSVDAMAQMSQLAHAQDRGSVVVELGRIPTSPSAAIEQQRLMDEAHEFAVAGVEPTEPADDSGHCAHCLDCHCVRPSLGDCVALCLPCLPLSAQKKREAALAAAAKKEKKEDRDKRVAAPGDHAKGSVLYAETIKALLNYGASIQKASNASGYPLSRLMDVTERWTEIYNTLNEIESQKKRVAKKYFKKIRSTQKTPEGKKLVLDLPQRREAKREMRLRQNVLHTLREHVFLDKENQVVIGQYYDDKIRRGRFTKFARYFFYLVLLSVLAIWETTTTPEGAYYLQRALKGSLGTPAFLDMKTKEDFFNWARTDLTSTLYSGPAFYDANNQLQVGNILQYNIVLNRPRFRQIRSKTTACDVPHEFKEFPVLSQNLCIANHLEEEDEASYTINGRSYTWEPDTGANLRWSRVARYPGSGYVTLLPNLGTANASQVAISTLDALQADNWINAGTRAVFFEMTLFNANKNIFFVVSMAVEFPREGGIVASHDFSVLRLRRYTDSADQKMFALEMIVLFLGMLHIWSESVQFRNSRGCEYFSSLYNWLDSSIVLLSCAIVAVHVASFILEKDVTWYDPDVYLKINRQEALAFAEQICFSLVVFFAWAKLFDYLSVFKEIYRFVIMIEMMAKRLGEFSIVFLLVIGMFTTAELVAYGYKDDASYSWPLAYVNRFIGVVAQNPVVFDHSNQARLLGTFYVVLFLIITVLLLMNLIIAMLTRAYEEALQLSSDVLAARQYEKLKDLGYTKPLPVAKRVFGIDEAANTPAEASYSEILDIRWYLVCASMARAVDDWMDRHCRSTTSIDLDEEEVLDASSHHLNTGGGGGSGVAYSADPLTGNLFAGR